MPRDRIPMETGVLARTEKSVLFVIPWRGGWLIGDTDSLSVDLQAEADELAEVAPITSGSGGAVPPSQPESQPDDQQQKAQ